MNAGKDLCRLLIENLPDAFSCHQVITDSNSNPIDYCFLSVNKAFEAMTGLSRDNVIGKNFSQVLLEVDEFDFDWLDVYGKVALTGGSFRFESFFKLPGRWYDVTASSDGTGLFITVFHDITEAKVTNESLRESQERFAHLFERAPLAYQSLDAEGRFIEINEAWLSTLGYNRDEVMGRWFGDFLVPEMTNKFAERFPAFKAAGETYSEFEMLHKSGERRIIAFNGRIGYKKDGSFERTHCILQDITEQKQRKKVLQESEEKFRRLFELSKDAHVLIDGENYVDCNPACVAMFGLTRREEVLSSQLGDFFPETQPDGRSSLETFKKLVEFTMARGSSRFEWVCCKADGTSLYLDVLLNRVLLHQRPIIHSAWRDITDRRLAEAALRDSEERYRALVEELKKVEQKKNEFICYLSHEIRNPISSIMLGLSLLDKVNPNGEKAKQAREVMNRQVKQLSRLIDDLLDVTRLTQNKIVIKKELVELNELARSVITEYQAMFQRKKIILNTKFTPGGVYVEGDGARLTQVMGNLLHNAAKFVGKGGSVDLAIFHDPLGNAVIKVADTGIGLDPAIKPHLFEPFIQANTSVYHGNGGLGLGLVLVKNLVKLHGGEATTHRGGPGMGSEFIITLHLSKEKAKAKIPRTSEEISLHSRRVLVIEDIKDVAEILQSLLEYEGHEVMVAYNGKEGISKAKTFQPEVILCDIGLPDIDGYHVASVFQREEKLKDIFRISLTGYAAPQDQQKAKEAGFHIQLTKPVELATLREALARVDGSC